LAKVDQVLGLVCALLLLPLLPVIWFKPDINDVLTYLSFIVASWGAVYSGRGVFSMSDASTKELETEPSIADDPQFCFATGVAFILTAALILAPTMYRKTPLAAKIGIAAPLILFCGALVTFSTFEFKRSGRRPFLRGLIWLGLPGLVLILTIAMFTS
jgi:hypothetical protein